MVVVIDCDLHDSTTVLRWADGPGGFDASDVGGDRDAVRRRLEFALRAIVTVMRQLAVRMRHVARSQDQEELMDERDRMERGNGETPRPSTSTRRLVSVLSETSLGAS